FAPGSRRPDRRESAPPKAALRTSNWPRPRCPPRVPALRRDSPTPAPDDRTIADHQHRLLRPRWSGCPAFRRSPGCLARRLAPVAFPAPRPFVSGTLPAIACRTLLEACASRLTSAVWRTILYHRTLLRRLPTHPAHRRWNHNPARAVLDAHHFALCVD